MDRLGKLQQSDQFLTPHEMTALQHCARDIHQVAKKMRVSVTAVRTDLAQAMETLGARDMAHAVWFAMRAGLLDSQRINHSNTEHIRALSLQAAGQRGQRGCAAAVFGEAAILWPGVQSALTWLVVAWSETKVRDRAVLVHRPAPAGP